jgi:diguanylate cyclase (GGDEF)-like protein/PAS domain S-box-containing protein
MTSTKRRPSKPIHTGIAPVPAQIVAANADETARATTRRPAAEDVSQQHREAMVTLDSIDSCVLRTDLRGNVIYMNRWAEMLTGWPQDEAMGRPVADVLPLFDGNSGEALNVATVLLRVRSAMARIGCLECKLVRRDGVEFGIENRITMVDDQAGNAVGAVITFRDVTVDRAASVESLRLAQHDVLTGLPNRTLFDDRLTQAISLARRQGKQIAVLFVDVDQFKRINDSLGHAMGDLLLRSIASRLTESVRRSDTVCRLGGDEFVILLSELARTEDAALVARKIVRTVAAPHIIDNKSLNINVSVGGSIYPEDGESNAFLISAADTAMYDAKRQGRNGYKFFRREMRERRQKRLLLERDLRCALGRNEFLLHYQPQVSLQTGQITGMEALIRWLHPERGMLFPGTFLPIAEECGLMVPIGQGVLLEACRQSRAWSDAGLGIVSVSVNVSAAEFHAGDFLSGVRAALIATGVEPVHLELELTETVLMQDAESAVVTLSALKAMGVRLAIDDFGTGYSSFTYLRRFPIDTIKLDQSFVKEITTEPEDITIVSAMIDIGKSLKRRVVAEGVETRSQLDFLLRHGCAEGQGYYFSYPVAADQAGTLLSTGLRQALVA